MKSLLLILALGLALPAFAQTQVRSAQIYRCGPDGRDLRDSPCPNAAAPANVDFDQPSGGDSKAARDRHLSEAKQAAALEKARRQRDSEARQQRAAAVGLQTLPPPAQAASGPQVTHLQPPKAARPKKPADSGR